MFHFPSLGPGSDRSHHFRGIRHFGNAYAIALWVCVKKRFSEAGTLKVIILKKGEAEMALDSDEAPTATSSLLDNRRFNFESLLLSSLSKSCTICSDKSLTSWGTQVFQCFLRPAWLLVSTTATMLLNLLAWLRRRSALSAYDLS